ncbi:phage portal protein [Bifidobacterium sp. ESL0769]|uniref:phage portal protein n=1 Tax=Bifidobacterium sp. ESL0769 TaxID=2983229 RepID=UPI0023F6ADCF|nr:phage portal protein [Bifidobacterium sp. ESL0769]WEV67964.1 phage portal protein [Bifidobacterium sp. ESL0769]
MSFKTRIAGTLGLLQRADVEKDEAKTDASDESPLSTPPTRERAMRDPLSMSTVFRAVQILETSVADLPVVQLRGGFEIDQAAIISKPDVFKSRREFIKETVASLALNGNAFWLKSTGVDGDVVNLTVLPPALVSVLSTDGDPANPIHYYAYMGHEYTSDDMLHLKFVSIPGLPRGRGPIEASREELRGAQEARDAKAKWFEQGDHPTGILTSDQPIDSDEEADLYKKRFEKNPEGVKVLGKGLSYEQLMLNPADMQYLETQQFDTTQIARLFGVPQSLMMNKVEGSSLTYRNTEEEWISFSDFTLAAYVQPIEDAFSELVPRNNEIDFRWDNMRRSDTKTRYEIYQLAIGIGLMTVNEARADAGRPPLSDEELAKITPQPQPKESSDAEA